MPSVETAANKPKTNETDDLDRLFGSDDELDHVFRDLSPPRAAPANANANAPNLPKDSGIGIEEEIEIDRKVRAPRVKLDETRLLSQAGIPKLRRFAGSKLKFRGKGHEYKDAQKLLSLYQLWLDDLFPKAQFLDALGMVEKLGHKKRVQMMRMEWINEGKPRPTEDDNLYNEPQVEPREPRESSRQSMRIAPIFETQSTERLKTPATRDNDAEEDIYGATPRPTKEAPGQEASIFGEGSVVSDSIFGPKKTTENIDDGHPEDDLDDLDALFEEENFLSGPSTSKAIPNQPVQHDDFDDDEEAMAEMGGMDDMW